MTGSSGSSSSSRSAGVDLVPGVLGGTWTTAIQFEEDEAEKEAWAALHQGKGRKFQGETRQRKQEWNTNM